MAKTGKFKCLKCKRRFKMAAHLGRHMSTIHAAKGKPARKKAAKRAVKRNARRRKVARTAARRPAAGVAASLVAQLRRCQRQLVDSREALSARITLVVPSRSEGRTSTIWCGVPAGPAEAEVESDPALARSQTQRGAS